MALANFNLNSQFSATCREHKAMESLGRNAGSRPLILKQRIYAQFDEIILTTFNLTDKIINRHNKLPELIEKIFLFSSFSGKTFSLKLWRFSC